MRILHVFLIATVGFSSARLSAQDFVPETKYQRGQAPRKQSSPVQNPSHVSSAQAWDKMDAWSFQFGSHTEFFNNIQTDTEGTQRKFEFAPTIGLGMKFSFSDDFKLLPEVNWVLPFRSGDSNMIKNLFMLRGDLGYEMLDWLRLRVGTSLMWLNMHGKGGKTKINNGEGQSTFYNPDENRSALNNTFDIGAELMFSKEWSVRLQTYTYSLFEEERRQISYSLLFAYYWE